MRDRFTPVSRHGSIDRAKPRVGLSQQFAPSFRACSAECRALEIQVRVLPTFAIVGWKQAWVLIVTAGKRKEPRILRECGSCKQRKSSPKSLSCTLTGQHLAQGEDLLCTESAAPGVAACSGSLQTCRRQGFSACAKKLLRLSSWAAECPRCARRSLHLP